MEKATSELIEILKGTRTIDEFLEKEADSLNSPSVSDEILALIKASGFSKADVIHRSGLTDAYGYQIFNGERNPSRDKLIMLSFGLSLDFDLTQHFLKRTRVATLYAKDPRDAVIIHAKQRGLSLSDTNELLYRLGTDILS